MWSCTHPMVLEWKPLRLCWPTSAAATQARALMESNRGVSSPAPPVHQPQPSSPPGFSRILFWNWSRKRNFKKRRESVRKWVREAEQDPPSALSPSTSFQCYSNQCPDRTLWRPARSLSAILPPPISDYKIEGSCMILAEQALLPSYSNYESDEEWWDSRMGLYFISVNNLKCAHLAFWESQIRWK